MSKVPLKLNEVRWLTIDEIAHHWAPERGTLSSIIRRELQLSLINLERQQRGLERIESLPPEDQRPPATTEISRDHLEEFCAKQRWPKPRFWFGDHSEGPSFPGRPSLNRAIVQELRERAQAGQLKATVAAQSEDLKLWVDQKHPGVQTPTARTIENIIRQEFRQLRAPRN
jgi:hypothetical protein